MIQHDKIIKPGSVYLIKNKGVVISDDNDNITKSDIEVHFDIDYPEQLDDAIRQIAGQFNITITNDDIKEKVEPTKEPITIEEKVEPPKEPIPIEVPKDAPKKRVYKKKTDAEKSEQKQPTAKPKVVRKKKDTQSDK